MSTHWLYLISRTCYLPLSSCGSSRVSSISPFPMHIWEKDLQAEAETEACKSCYLLKLSSNQFRVFSDPFYIDKIYNIKFVLPENTPPFLFDTCSAQVNCRGGQLLLCSLQPLFYPCSPQEHEVISLIENNFMDSVGWHNTVWTGSTVCSLCANERP